MPANDLVSTVFPLLLIVLAFWLLVIRPARKRRQEMSRIQSSVSTGAEVMLGSGVFGTVASVEDDTLLLEVAPGTVIKVARQAVVRVVVPSVDTGTYETPTTTADLSDDATPDRAPGDRDAQ